MPFQALLLITQLDTGHAACGFQTGKHPHYAHHGLLAALYVLDRFKRASVER